MRKKLIFLLKLWKDLNLKEKLFISVGILLGLFFLILPAWWFWQNNFEKLPSNGGVLREGLYQSINTLNPFLVANSSEKSLLNLLFDKLIVDDGSGNFSYELAKNITELNKGLEFLVELKDDKIWNNKEKITSDDLIFSFEIFKKYGSDEVKNLFRDTEIEKVDNYQVKFNLKIRDNYFYNKLNQIYIIPKSVWQKFNQPDWQSQEDELLSVVSGPYIIEKKLDSEVVFVRNEFYKPNAYIEKIVFKIYPNLQNAIEGLRIREIDAIGGVPSNVLKSTTSRRLKVSRIVLPRAIGIFFNSKNVGGIDANGLESLIDRKKMNEEIFDNEAEISTGIFSKSIRNFLNLPVNKSNVKSNTDMSITFSTSSLIEVVVPQNYFFQKIADFIGDKIPIKIVAETTENIYSDILQNKKYQAIILGINYNLPPNISPFFMENSSFNLINKATPNIAKFLQKLSIEQLNQEDYADTIENLEKEILQTNSVVFLVNPYYLYIIPKNLKGYNLIILRQPEERFAKIELWNLKTKTKWR
ncbi:MAG: ABC transporter substrate-binding protein [Patescibacteria group bacterium]